MAEDDVGVEAPGCAHTESADVVVPKRPPPGVLGVVGVEKDGSVLGTAGDGDEKLKVELAGVVATLVTPKEGAALPNEKLVDDGAGEALLNDALVESGVDVLSKEKTVFCPQDTMIDR